GPRIAGLVFLLLAAALPARAAVRRLATNSGQAGPPRVNDAGAVVLQDPINAANTDHEIAWWSGVAWQLLPHPTADDAQPRINNRGQIVWQGFDGTDWEIYLWDGLTILPLTGAGMAHTDPQINDA